MGAEMPLVVPGNDGAHADWCEGGRSRLAYHWYEDVGGTPIGRTLNQEKLDEVALAILCLTKHDMGGVPVAWKGLDWALTDRLHEKGWIHDPRGKAKSVAFTEEGARLAETLLEKHFGQP